MDAVSWDAHWGYGFPIGGVAAFDLEQGVVTAGGVGFDISCGGRTMLTGLRSDDIRHVQYALADSLMRDIPAGVGSEGAITLDDAETEAMLRGGATWAISRGWGQEPDLERIEEGGRVTGAEPEIIPDRAKERQWREMGTVQATHVVNGKRRELFIHRKGATRAFGAGTPGLPDGLRATGQAGTCRRKHGHGILCARRRGGWRGQGLFLGMSRRRARHFAPRRAETLERPPGHRRTGGARHHRQKSIPPRWSQRKPRGPTRMWRLS